jgi:hypothetical protein
VPADVHSQAIVHRELQRSVLQYLNLFFVSGTRRQDQKRHEHFMNDSILEACGISCKYSKTTDRLQSGRWRARSIVTHSSCV